MKIERGPGHPYLRHSFAAIGVLFLLSAPTFAQYAPQAALLDATALQGQAADEPAKQDQTPEQKSQAEKDAEAKKNDRMFFVMPNFLTVENEAHVTPISAKQKFVISAKGTFDPYEFVVVGILAGIRQAENAYPGFGQGFEGYGKRYGAGFADQVDGNMLVGGVFPTILRTDPRYFQLGKGKFVIRFGYAISRIFITRRDSGGRLFNFPEFAGNASAIAISNLYYPAADRGFSESANSWGVQMGIDALGNELKEFWPDIHRRLPKKKKPADAAASNPAD